MRTISLPGTTLTLSVLGLGGAGLGTRANREDSFQILDLFAELGGTFLDTAHIYAAWVPGGQGVSERTIGDWLHARGMQGRMVVGTKGGHPQLHSMSQPRLSPAEIRQDLEESLERLQLSTVDIYWLHRDDPSRPVEEILAALAIAQQEGRIRCYGLSNWTPGRLRQALDAAAALQIPAPVASQVGWSLAQPNPNSIADPSMLFMDSPTYQFHQETGLPVVAYASQAGGLFTADWERETPPSGLSGASLQTYDSDTTRQRISRALDLARRRRCALNDVALAYLLSQPFPVIALIGCGTPDHLRESCRAGDLVLEPEELRWLTNDEV